MHRPCHRADHSQAGLNAFGSRPAQREHQLPNASLLTGKICLWIDRTAQAKHCQVAPRVTPQEICGVFATIRQDHWNLVFALDDMAGGEN
jgi:hypothetical protein